MICSYALMSLILLYLITKENKPIIIIIIIIIMSVEKEKENKSQ